MSTSITKNRLLHLSDLPNIQKYSPIDINKLLPIHYSTLRDNILTMIHYQSVNFTSKILLHDPNLTIHSTNYSQIKGGWCEDYDEKNQISSAACIKKSIEIGVLILNYLQAMCQATIKHNHRQQEEQHDTCQIISKGECFTGTKLINHQQLLHSRLSSLNNSNLKLTPNQSVDQEVKTSIENRSIDFDKEHNCFDQQTSLVISYNIFKKNKKYIFITGVNECFTMNFFNSLCLYRHWNLERLKINHKLVMNFDKLSRLNVYFEHLFSIARGFIFSSLQAQSSRAPFSPMADPNDNKKHLKVLLEQFEIEKDLQNSSELIFQQIKHKHSQIFAILDDTLKVYRFCFTYKMDGDSVEAKNFFMIKLGIQFSRVLAKILTEIPINMHASYCFKSVHNQVTNQVVILMIFNYKQKMAKRIFMTSEEVKLSLKNLVGYLNKENYEVVQKAQRNIADQVFKSSYLIFNKYNEILENTQSLEYSQKELKEKLSHVRFAASGSNLQTFGSLGLPPLTSKKHILANQTGNKQSSLSQNSTIFSKSPGYSEIQVGYRKLLISLEDRFELNCILDPIKLKKALKQHLQPFQDINTSQALQKDEKQSLWFLGISNQMLQPEDIYHMILKFQDCADAICEYFMQQYNYEKMVEVGKLFSSKLQQLFKDYLSIENGSKSFRYNMVVCFMKKLLQKYYLKTNQKGIRGNNSIGGSPVKHSRHSSPQKTKVSHKSLYPELDLTELNMEELIYLLQLRTYKCTEYKNLVLAFMPQIFQYRPQCQYVSGILYHFYIHLLNNDHHQDLVSSFIGDLFYEIVFFTNEITSITLDNSRYRKNLVDLKEKKFYEVIRDGGFINFGFNVRNLLIPQLINTQPVVKYQHLIVSTLRIERPNYFKTVVKMIQGSFFSKNFTFLTELINNKDIYYDSVNQPLCMPFYPKQLQVQIQALTNPQEKRPHKQEVNDALQNISRSESGIFRDLISLNPDLKIAGINLKEEYAKKMREREEEEQKYTVKQFLGKIAKIDLEQAWEYIQLVLQFKDKVIEVENAKTGLHIDNQLEKNLIYVKETFQHIYSKLSKIYNYIALSDVVYEIAKINSNLTSTLT